MRTEINSVVLDSDGHPVIGAAIQVDVRGGGAATVYLAETGVSELTNPLTSDSSGRINGWLERGQYQATISEASIDTFTENWDSAPAGDAGIDDAWLEDAIISTLKLIDGAVTAIKLASNSVTTAKIVDAAITVAKLGDLAVSTAKIQDGAVTLAKLAAGAIPGTDGWTTLPGSWAYGSADAPTYTMTSSTNVSTVVSVGFRIKLTQSATVKYFIVTAISWSGTVTTITLLAAMTAGTPDNSGLANSAISAQAYSPHKVPYGFPIDPAKWTITMTDSSDRIQTAPTSGVWYNLGSLSISIPIGAWDVYYQVTGRYLYSASGSIDGSATLSTGATTESDRDFTASTELGVSSNAATRTTATFHRRKLLVLTVKTSYFLNSKMGGSNTSMSFMGAVYSPTIVRAVCAYL